MDDLIAQAHDTAVRQFFDIDHFAEQVFRYVLPVGVADLIDMAALQRRPDRFNDPSFRWSATDVLFEAKMRASQVKLYLMVEHQSEIDRSMPLRLWVNTGRLWTNEWETDSSNGTLPIVLPMVITHAPKRWRVPTDIREMLAGLDSLPPFVVDQMPRMSYIVLDLRSMSNEQLISAKETASLRLFLLGLRNSRDRKIVSMFGDWRPLLAAAEHEPGGKLLKERLVTYLGFAVKGMTQKMMTDIVETAGLAPDWLRESFWWKQYQEGVAREREEGRKEGHQEGHQEGLVEGRKEGRKEALMQLLARHFGPLPTHVRDMVKKASSKELECWTGRFKDAKSLKEVLGSVDDTA